MKPLRLMIYDDTCRGRPGLPGLTHSWIVGGKFYNVLGRLDAWKGCRSWEEALDWLATFEPERPIAEVQFWGHGKWGRAMIDRQRLDITDLSPASALFHPLLNVRARMTGPDALWWFRTCETFGAKVGHEFARAWTDTLECRAAGHTYIIGPWQSGLHALKPGDEIDWSVDEGLVEGTPDSPKKALWSTARAPNTISCLRGDVPNWAWTK